MMPAEPKKRTCVDIRAVRERLGLSQSEFADLVGFSARTIQSCEQGWRQPSPALCRMSTLLLIAQEQGPDFGNVRCWEEVDCPPETRDDCIAYRSRQGHLCWFLTGTTCGGKHLHDWEQKHELCSGCDVFRKLLGRPGEALGKLSGHASSEPRFRHPSSSTPGQLPTRRQ
jgi:DNA-binding XRE family transcriptional regulator